MQTLTSSKSRCFSVYSCNLQLFGLSNQTIEDCPVEASCQFRISCSGSHLDFLLRQCRNDCFYYFVNKFQPIIIGNSCRTNAKIGFMQLNEVLVGGGGGLRAAMPNYKDPSPVITNEYRSEYRFIVITTE